MIKYYVIFIYFQALKTESPSYVQVSWYVKSEMALKCSVLIRQKLCLHLSYVRCKKSKQILHNIRKFNKYQMAIQKTKILIWKISPNIFFKLLSNFKYVLAF